jgi:predicted metal-dependent hydrolase
MSEAIISGVAVVIVAIIEAIAARDRRQAKRERTAEEEQRKRQEQLLLLLVQSVWACTALGEATARAVQRIPDAHCNGDMHDALAYVARTKHEQKDFLAKQGIHAVLDTEGAV